IVIVDGVRYTNSAAFDPARTGFLASNTGTTAVPSIYGPDAVSEGGARTEAAQKEVTSPLNDININDIETIEVVKGPTAATLYGTDAANGVIVITTKRGHRGPVRWAVSMNGTLSESPNPRLLSEYWAWGSKPDGSPYGTTSSGIFIPMN